MTNKKNNGVQNIRRNYVTKDGTVKTYNYTRVTVNRSIPTMCDYAEKLLKSRCDCKEATKQQLLGVLERHIRPVFNDISIGDVIPDDLQLFLNESENSQHQIKQIFTTTFRAAVMNGYIDRDTSYGLTLPRYKNGEPIERKKERQMPTRQQLDTFSAVVRESKLSLTYAVILQFCTGLDRRETLGLKKTDFNLDDCYIDVQRSWSKDVVNGGFHICGLKNKYRYRRVYFPKELVPALRKAFARTKSEWFAPCRNGKQPIDGDNYSKRYFVRMAKEAGITVPFSPHMARHIYITNAIDQHVPPTEIMKQVGHSDLRMIIEVYTHYIRNDKPSPEMEAYMSTQVQDFVTQKSDSPTNNIIYGDFKRRVI